MTYQSLSTNEIRLIIDSVQLKNYLAVLPCGRVLGGQNSYRLTTINQRDNDLLWDSLYRLAAIAAITPSAINTDTAWLLHREVLRRMVAAL